MENKNSNENFMEMAIRQAKIAYKKCEVPVGVVIVLDGVIIARAYNKVEMKNDATAHAEILAIQKASKKLGSWRLSGCDLYVTLSPCPMCVGAIIASRIRNVYFGAYDNRFKEAISLLNLFENEKSIHNTAIFGGILKDDCQTLITSFFKMLRNKL